MRPPHSPKTGTRGGFTVVELLVVVGVLVILAYVIFGSVPRKGFSDNEPIESNRAHQLGALCFAYSNDNYGIYPYGPDGHTIANVLLNGNYADDPSLFFYVGTPGCTKYTGSPSPYDLKPANCCWDFWVSGSTGMGKDANELTPLVQQTAGIAMTGLPTTAGTGATLTIDSSKATLGSKGIAVYYKGNYAVFIKCTPESPTTAINLPTSGLPYVGPRYADPLGATYHSVLP